MERSIQGRRENAAALVRWAAGEPAPAVAKRAIRLAIVTTIAKPWSRT
jgi:hypothetical protein